MSFEQAPFRAFARVRNRTSRQSDRVSPTAAAARRCAAVQPAWGAGGGILAFGGASQDTCFGGGSVFRH